MRCNRCHRTLFGCECDEGPDNELLEDEPTAPKHTPGPWKVCGDNMQIVATKDGYDPSAKTIVFCVEHHNRSVNSPIACDEGYANARLMAAAPDLLEALRAGLEWSEGDGLLDDSELITPMERSFRKAARDAIAKATAE